MSEPVMHFVLPWAESMADPRPAHVGKVVAQPDGSLSLCLWLRGARPDGTSLPNRLMYAVPVRVGDPESVQPTPGAPYQVDRFGLRRIGPGVWVVSPSVWVPGVFHAYVVLHDVPEPAPFA